MENFKIDDLGKYKYLSGVKHSLDEKHACFVLHESSVEENKYLSNLWILDVESEKYYKLTSFDSERSFLWLDNENIIFPDVREDKDKEKLKNGEEFTQYYKINIHGGEAEKFLRINKGISSIKIIDENTYIFTAEYNGNQKELYLLGDEEKDKELKARKEEKDYEVLEEIPFWTNGGTFTSRKRERLYIYHVDTDKIEAITDEYTNVGAFEINKAKTKVLIISNSFKNKMEIVDTMSILELETGKIEKLNEENPMAYYYANFISENNIIFAASDMKKLGLNQNAKFYLFDLKAKEGTCITPDLDVSIYSSVGSDCRYGDSSSMQVYGEYLYFTTTEDDSSFLNRMDKNGEISKLTFDKGSVDGISVSSSSILFVGMKPSKLQELFQLENGSEKKITTFNDWVQTERKVSEPIEVTVETAVGVTIKGWVIKPVDFDENKKYPAILDVHGGPKTVYGTVFYNEMQYWASEGYAVFFCNPRGSDGRGDDFSDIRGKYGTIDFNDIMKFTDEVINKFSFIDGNRIGVTGGSYGGFMTNWIIGHTDRFKAAASQRSISNWVSKFGTTDIGYFFVEDQNSATPWNNQEKLWDHSPLKYADKAKTPTLFLHSEEDYRCWIAEAFQMFTALKYHGVDSKLIMFRGENHELSRSGKPKHKIRRLKEITEWFNKYLR
ncbi:alpha/beta hydrolase family protein [Clostridium hydrogenum]|uniref:alpha/beta hydrolase family protein n=1 Tax=Clostridium hydrogenum TaxID=2855764 RepID=UPI002E34171D|nr:prolyl oligopeptidase family serine peptidase [Clostridium hydrogenum]